MAILANFLTNDVSDALKDEKPKEPAKIPIEITVKPEQRPTEEAPIKIADPNQKFYPKHFLPALEYFVGRVDVLERIKKTLAADHRAAIHDISGLGKTFTSYKFAADNEENYDKIFFILATKEEMLESLAKCGEMVDPQLASVEKQEDKAFGFKQWLEDNEKWLVIYDNVDKPDELHPFVPVNKKGDCLFTSNFREVIRLGTEISVEKLDVADAGILLYSRATNQPQTSPNLEGEEKQAFDEIVKEIDGLPLTLNSTGAMIFNKDWKFANFWQKYEQSPEIAWESEDKYSPYQRRSAGIVFSLAYDELNQTPKVGKAVRVLLNAMSFLSPDEIPEDMLQEILRESDESFADLKDGDDLWDDVRERLTGYDLLKYNKDKCIFTTHRSIQRVIETKLATGEMENVCVKLSETLLNLFPKYDHFNRAACEKYSQHVQTLLENSDKFCIEIEGTISLYYRLGHYHRLSGNFNNAERFYLRSSEISGKVSGKESTAYATDLNNLALIYQDQGRYNEALEKFEETLRIDEKTIGKEHPDYAIDLNNLARVYKAQGRYDEALEKCEEALRIDEKTIGKEHPDYAAHLNNLAGVYKSQGRYNKALEKCEEALRIDEKTIGKEHPDYAVHLNNLANVYEAQSRFDEALGKYEEVRRIDEKTIGTEHPDYAIHLSNLARIYETQARYKEALELYEKALKIDEKTLPGNHPYTLQDRESVERCRKMLKETE